MGSIDIAPGGVEVGELLLDHGDLTTLVELHPEMCFRALAEDIFQFNKKTAPGIVKRLTALECNTEYEEGMWRRIAASFGENDHDTGVNDLLDALWLALTTKAPDEECHRLPSEPPSDAESLPIQMV